MNASPLSCRFCVQGLPNGWQGLKGKQPRTSLALACQAGKPHPPPRLLWPTGGCLSPSGAVKPRAVSLWSPQPSCETIRLGKTGTRASATHSQRPRGLLSSRATAKMGTGSCLPEPTSSARWFKPKSCYGGRKRGVCRRSWRELLADGARRGVRGCLRSWKEGEKMFGSWYYQERASKCLASTLPSLKIGAWKFIPKVYINPAVPEDTF